MGQLLQEENLVPDLILSPTAKRAHKTTQGAKKNPIAAKW
jgi:phosphohistidine phosphatase SixA